MLDAQREHGAQVERGAAFRVVVARDVEAHETLAIGGALVLEEKNATGDALYEAAASILHQVGRREKMERAMAGIGVRDASERIMKVLHELTDTE